ncbi:MAG: hypothetical protein WD669_10400 [Pirellulales bacterium]
MFLQPSIWKSEAIGVSVVALVLAVAVAARTVLAFQTPACPDVNLSVPQGHDVIVNPATCSDPWDCNDLTLPCTQSPASYCGSGFENWTTLGEDAQGDIGGKCREVNTQCGYCYVNGICDPITHIADQGNTRDVDGDDFADIGYVPKCD